MKEKINQFSNGTFTYELPRLIFSAAKISIEAEAGRVYRGSFGIKNTDGIKMRGIVFAQGCHIRMADPKFNGPEHQADFEFDALSLDSGHTEKGVFTVAGSIGEAELPFEAIVVEPGCGTGLQKISDLFQFTNLAKSNPSEAAAIFLSEEFERVFLKGRPEESLLYRNITGNPDKYRALEEFLVAVHKKLPVFLSVEDVVPEYHVASKSMSESVTLRKDNWGYIDIRVDSDVPYIIPEQEHLTGEKFAGNTYELSFILKAELMRGGRNFGTITIHTPQQDIPVRISVMCARSGRPFPSGSYKKKAYMLKLTNNYIRFRLKKMTAEQYATSTKAVLYGWKAINQDRLLDLMSVHLSIVTGKRKEAGEQLDAFMEQAAQDEPIVRAAYLYLKAMHTESEEDAAKAVQETAALSAGQPEDWRYVWLLFYTDSRFDRHPEDKLELIKSLSGGGCCSPVLYLEACSVLSSYPNLLKRLDTFEIRVLHWGIRNGLYSKKLTLRFTYLAASQKQYDKLLFLTLADLYGRTKDKETLSAVCSMLIKGQKTEGSYFKWYALGVENGLKLTELHEYYMYALDEKKDQLLSPQIYVYFSYSNDLTDRKKAYLYSRVIKEKAEKNSLYVSYAGQIREFALAQLGQHMMSEYLAGIYEEVFQPDTITEEICADLPEVLFQHMVLCGNSNVKGVVVVHRELEGEQYAAVEDGRAFVDICTETAKVYLVDAAGNRFAATIPYTVEPLLNPSALLESPELQKSTDARVGIYFLTTASKYHKYQIDLVELRKRMLDYGGISVEFRTEMILGLVRHYYDYYDAELLEDYLRRIELKCLPAVKRREMMELMLIRGMSDLVYPALQQYGPEGIASKHLLKFTSELIAAQTEEGGHTFLLYLCGYLFTQGKYDTVTLSCLADLYEGTTETMLEVWLAAQKMGVPAEGLEERILTQALFTENLAIQVPEVFLSYSKKGTNRKLIRAYLSYTAYRYLVSDRAVQQEVFGQMKNETFYGDNDVCKMALLKYYSTKPALTGEEADFAQYQLHRAVRLCIVLPFFKEFRGKCRVPSEIMDKQYVYFISDPKDKVEIHYRILGSSLEKAEFLTERMKNTYMGIFVKEFLLFYGEELQYYISVRKNGITEIEESLELTLDNKQDSEEETQYHMLNLMLIAREMQDEKTLMELMEQYVKQKYATDKLFRL